MIILDNLDFDASDSNFLYTELVRSEYIFNIHLSAFVKKIFAYFWLTQYEFILTGFRYASKILSIMIF